MRTKLLFALSLIVLALFAVQPLAFSSQDRVAELEKEIEEISSRMRELEAENEKTTNYLERLKSLRKETEEYLSSIDGTAKYAGKRAKEIELKIAEVEKEIESAERELAETEKRLAEKREILASRLRSLYMNGFTSYLEMILSSRSLADFFVRYQYVAFLLESDKNLIERVMAEVEKAKENRLRIEEKFEEYEKTLSLLGRMQGVLKEERVYVRQNLSEVRTKIAAVERITQEQERLLSELARKQKELLELKERLEFAKQAGTFLYPLEGGPYPVTSRFGPRTDPVSGEENVMHNGLDIAAPAYTNVLAASDGYVLVAGWYGGYGNCVVLDHGNGIWTVYGHMMDESLRVKVGDFVRAGDVVGQVGTTGKSTGYHLHFEVRVDGQATDPAPYLGMIE